MLPTRPIKVDIGARSGSLQGPDMLSSEGRVIYASLRSEMLQGGLTCEPSKCDARERWARYQ